VQPTDFAMPAQNLINVGVGGSNPFACSRFSMKTQAMAAAPVAFRADQHR
jgi:hypothetical protein